MLGLQICAIMSSLWGAGDWTQGFMYVKQKLYQLSSGPAQPNRASFLRKGRKKKKGWVNSHIPQTFRTPFQRLAWWSPQITKEEWHSMHLEIARSKRDSNRVCDLAVLRVSSEEDSGAIFAGNLTDPGAAANSSHFHHWGLTIFNVTELKHCSKEDSINL